METFLIIGLGGFVGANLRYLISVWAVEHLGVSFPWGTVFINFTGSLLLAVFFAWAARHTDMDARFRLLIAVGFFGAYTTFSTFANESVALAMTGNWIGAVGNVLGTNLLCIGGALVGLLIGRQL